VITLPSTWAAATKTKQLLRTSAVKKAWSYKIKTFTLRFKVLSVFFIKEFIMSVLK
jgi:hypothetical protein